MNNENSTELQLGFLRPMGKTILLGLTSTPMSDWREKVEEIKKFSIKEIALFPTMLSLEERKQLYHLLEGTVLVEIPHVHLRADMEEWEIRYLQKRFNTKVFNIHGDHWWVDFPKKCPLDLQKSVFVENLFEIDDIFLDFAEFFGGICVDFSHWEDMGIIQKKLGYEKFASLLQEKTIGCSHISAMTDQAKIYKGNNYVKDHIIYSRHWMDNLSQLDYVKKYLEYLPQLISIELENSFEEQLKVKEYLENLING